MKKIIILVITISAFKINAQKDINYKPFSDFSLEQPDYSPSNFGNQDAIKFVEYLRYNFESQKDNYLNKNPNILLDDLEIVSYAFIGNVDWRSKGISNKITFYFYNKHAFFSHGAAGMRELILNGLKRPSLLITLNGGIDHKILAHISGDKDIHSLKTILNDYEIIEIKVNE